MVNLISAAHKCASGPDPNPAPRRWSCVMFLVPLGGKTLGINRHLLR